MSPEQTELLRSGILLQLHAAYPSSLRAETLLANVRLIQPIKGLDQATLVEQLRYLEAKDMVAHAIRPLSGGALQYTLTDAGRAWLDQAHLI